MSAPISPSMLTLAVFGLVVIASSLLGDFGLTPLGKWSLRTAGIIAIGVGIALA